MAKLLQLREERDGLLTEKASFAVTSKQILDSAREDHAQELRSIVQEHTTTIESLRRDHSSAIDEWRSTLENARQEHQVETDGAREASDKLLDDLKKTHAEALAQALSDQEILVVEMEKSLASSEELRRQTKMRADRTMFELSKVRDEHQYQSNADSRQIADLQKINSNLECIRDDLETANGDLQRRLTDLESRYSTRKGAAVLPPQGPPPNAPLPPLPAPLLPSPISKTPTRSSDGDMSTSTHRSSGSTALTSIAEIGAAVAQMPEMVGQVVQKVVAERDSAVSEREALRVQLAAEANRLAESVSLLTFPRVKLADRDGRTRICKMRCSSPKA